MGDLLTPFRLQAHALSLPPATMHLRTEAVGSRAAVV